LKSDFDNENMFKELKVLKLVLFVVILLLIIFNINFNKYSGVTFFSSKASYQLGEKIEVNVGNLKNSSIKYQLKISNWNGDIVVEEVIETALKVSNESLLYSEGFQNTFTKDITSTIKNNGIYFINDSIPFFVNSNNSKDITVIYPSLGNLLINRFGDSNQNAFDDISKTIWSQRPVGMDEKSRNLMNFLKNEFSNLSIEYVSDVDTKIGEVINNSKLLIIYGYCRYTTIENWKAINDYIVSGGKVLFFNTYFPEYTMERINEKQLKFTFNAEGKFEMVTDSLIPFHYNTGGYASEMKYQKGGNAISNLNYSSLKVNGNGNLFVGSKVGEYWYSIPTKYNDLNGKSGVIMVNNQLVSMGTEEWLADENFSREEIRNTTKEVVNYMLKIK